MRGAAQTHAGFAARAQHDLNLLQAQMAAGSGIGRARIVHMRRGSKLTQFLAGAKAGVGQTGLFQPRQGRFVNLAASALHVGTTGTARIGAMIPVKAEPVQVFQQSCGIVRP